MHTDLEASAQHLLCLREHVDTKPATKKEGKASKLVRLDGYAKDARKRLMERHAKKNAAMRSKREQWRTDRTAKEWHGIRSEARSRGGFRYSRNGTVHQTMREDGVVSEGATVRQPFYARQAPKIRGRFCGSSRGGPSHEDAKCEHIQVEGCS